MGRTREQVSVKAHRLSVQNLHQPWCSLVRPARGSCRAGMLAWPQDSLQPSDDAAECACCRRYTKEPDRCLL